MDLAIISTGVVLSIYVPTIYFVYRRTYKQD